MPIIAGLLLLWLSSILLRGFVRANPTVLSRHLRRGGGWLALTFAIFMMVRGEFNFAFGAACFGFWLLGTGPNWMRGQFAGLAGGMGRGGHPRAQRRTISRVRTASLEMALDQATGSISGHFTAGPAQGRSLDGLSEADCVQLHGWCQGADPQGARLLETYLDRRFAGWRKADQDRENTRRADPGFRRPHATQMSDSEAYQILGLAQGAAREDITRAHRRLMKTYHPDHGGSTDLAARVNEAKDVLLRRNA